MTQAFDVCIRGDGIVGRTLALLLAREHLRVGLVVAPLAAPQAMGSPPADVRAYALNAKSKALLESLRCWPDALHATAVLNMEVQGDAGGAVNFSAADLKVPGLAWIVDVPALESCLAQALRFQAHIELLTAPEPATLSVICDGKASTARAEFGIDYEVTPYAQEAIAARLSCATAHRQIARQWFAQGEILAFLPLEGPQGNSVALVWSVAQARAPALLRASPAEFCQQLEHISGPGLGSLTLVGERQAWPLQLARARRFAGVHRGQAWVLAGDAAHTVHPLAGQGLNLGLADVQALVAVLRQREYWRDVGDPKLLRRYERARQAQVLALGLTTDGLQRLFAHPGALWQTVRNWGMNGFEHSAAVKHWVARQAMFN